MNASHEEKKMSDVLAERRSTPRFGPEPVRHEDLEKIIRAGLESPSGYNLQPWRFVVVRDPEQRKKLRAAVHDQPKVEQAPVVIVALGDLEGWREGDVDEMIRIGAEHGYAHPSKSGSTRQLIHDYLSTHENLPMWLNRQVMIALTTMMLMAEVLGYDTALMEGFEEPKVKEVVGAPERMIVVCLLAIGVRTGDDKRFGGRFPESRVLFGERFGRPFPLDEKPRANMEVTENMESTEEIRSQVEPSQK
ncbi:MAG TPA: nitroreductase family protein [Terriglobales bacterium]|nr:nitroreductase family protein [Terriglobales bacterium]